MSRLASGLRLVALVALLALVLSSCSALEPRPDDLPMHLPSNDFAFGIDTGLIWGDDDGLQLAPSAGLEVSWLDGAYGLHGGVAFHPEADVARVAVRAEATVWYAALFGVGLRAGPLTRRPWDRELAEPAPTRPPAFATDLTALMALPLAVWRREGQGAFVVLPYVRPGLRLGGGTRDGATSGIHELGLMLRWTTYAF